MIYKNGIKLLIKKSGSLNNVIREGSAVGNIIEEKDPAFYYIRAIALHCGETNGPNGNGDYFPKKELLASYKTFIGKRLDREHDTKDIIGTVLDAYPVEDPETKEFYIETISKINKKDNPDIVNDIENNNLKSVSMEVGVEESQCSVCGCIAHTQTDFCSHLESSNLLKEFQASIDNEQIGVKTGSKVKAFSINRGLHFNGLAVVMEPADNLANIKSKFANLTKKVGDSIKHILSNLKADEYVELEKHFQEKQSSKGETGKSAIGYITISFFNKSGHALKMSTLDFYTEDEKEKSLNELIGSQYKVTVTYYKDNKDIIIQEQNPDWDDSGNLILRKQIEDDKSKKAYRLLSSKKIVNADNKVVQSAKDKFNNNIINKVANRLKLSKKHNSSDWGSISWKRKDTKQSSLKNNAKSGSINKFSYERAEYLNHVKLAYQKALDNMKTGNYQQAYSSIINAIDNFDTQFGSDFHLEYVQKHPKDLLGRYRLEVNGTMIDPDNMEEYKDMIEEAIQGAFEEIEEEFEILEEEKNASLNKISTQEDMRFDNEARVEIWVDKYDIQSHIRFDNVMKEKLSQKDKIQKLKEIALDIAYDKLQNISGEGIDITVELSLNNVSPDRINWYKMIEDWEEEQKEEQEYQESLKNENKNGSINKFSYDKTQHFTANFISKNPVAKSIWQIKCNDKIYCEASLEQIWGDTILDNLKFGISKEYGDQLIAKISKYGINKVASILKGEHMQDMKNARIFRKTNLKKYASAFDKLETNVIIIGNGYQATKDTVTNEIVVTKEGMEVGRYTDAFCDDVVSIMKFFRNLFGLDKMKEETSNNSLEKEILEPKKDIVLSEKEIEIPIEAPEEKSEKVSSIRRKGFKLNKSGYRKYTGFTSITRFAKKNEDVIQMFIRDSFPKDRRSNWGTENLRINKEDNGWSLMNYATKLLYRSDESSDVYFNTQKYSVSTSRIQNSIRNIANINGIKLNETDESGINAQSNKKNEPVTKNATRKLHINSALINKKASDIKMSTRKLSNGDLEISIDEESQQKIARKVANGNISDNFFYETFEYLIENGFEWVEPEIIGALTDSPILTDGSYSDDGKTIEPMDASFWWYPNYMIRSPLVDLAETGKTVFRSERRAEAKKLKHIIHKSKKSLINKKAGGGAGISFENIKISQGDMKLHQEGNIYKVSNPKTWAIESFDAFGYDDGMSNVDGKSVFEITGIKIFPAKGWDNKLVIENLEIEHIENIVYGAGFVRSSLKKGATLVFKGYGTMSYRNPETNSYEYHDCDVEITVSLTETGEYWYQDVFIEGVSDYNKDTLITFILDGLEDYELHFNMTDSISYNALKSDKEKAEFIYNKYQNKIEQDWVDMRETDLIMNYRKGSSKRVNNVINKKADTDRDTINLDIISNNLYGKKYSELNKEEKFNVKQSGEYIKDDNKNIEKDIKSKLKLKKEIADISLGDQSNKEEPNAARKVEKIEETISNASLQNGIAINNNHLSLMIEGKIAEKTRMCQKLAEKMAKKGLLKCDDSEISLQFSSGMSIIDAHKKALYEATERKSKELMTMSKEAILKLDKETDAVIIKSAKKSNYLTRTPMSDIQTKSEETDVDVLGKQLKKRLSRI